MRREANGADTKPFTIIAPGDLTPESDFSTLIQGYARFRENWNQPSRLYLLGRTLNARVAKSLQDELRARHLQDDVTITGSLDHDCVRRLLETGDLCVVLNAQDPGLPETLVPAASAGLPVLSSGTTAFGIALGATGFGPALEPVSVDQLATKLLKLANQPEELAALVAEQRKFRADTGARAAAETAKILFNALGLCGLALPIPAVERAQYIQQLGFTVAGHFEGSYSIAAVNRMLAAALEHQRQGSVSVLPIAHHQILNVLNEIPAAEQALQQRLFTQRHPNGEPVIVISQHFPPWSPTIPNDLALSLFTWEESLVPAEIVATLNNGFTGVLAVSRFVAKTLIDSGVQLPVRVAGQGVDVGKFQPLAIARAEQSSQLAEAQPTRFIALHVSSCFPRKGTDILLEAWAKAFTADDDVCLIIKTFPNPHQRLADDLEHLRAGQPNLAAVELIDRDLAEEELRSLYLRAHCMVLPTRGEGFNMVAAEALLADLPVIVTGFGGHLDFVNSGNARLLDFRFAASRSHVAGEGAFWAEPELNDLISALHEAFAAHQGGRDLVRLPTTAEFAKFDTTSWATRTTEFAAELLFDRPRSLRRIAWISSWAVRCGIAEYSKELLEHRKIGPGEPDVLMLCDSRSIPVIRRETAGASVRPAWHFGAGAIAIDIAPHLKSYEPQVLIIQHQDGLISWQDLVAILEQPSSFPLRVIVFLHSTEAIGSLYHKLRATVLFALTLADRVIVHTLHDLENLRRLGLFENVTVLPHGAAGKMIASRGDVPELLRSPVIGCYGFFLPHKGISKLIEAFAEVLKEWPAARLRLVNAAFPSETSTMETKTCRALARQLSVDHAIDWHLDYLDKMESQKLLHGCDLIVLAYDQTPESASGAVRHALASGSPVAASHSAIFDELGAAVHRVNAAGGHELYCDIAALLRDTEHRRSTLISAAAWLAKHDWSAMAKRLFDMAAGLWQLRGTPPPSRLTLTPRSNLLENRIGRRTDSQLVFTGEGDEYGLYGPYVDLAAGSYKAVFSFDRMSELSGNARFEIVSHITSNALVMLEQTFSEGGQGEPTEITVHFSLPQRVPEIEFRIFCHPGFKGVFNALSIERLSSSVA